MRNNKNNITLSLEDIISFSRNITSHFTGKAKIITLVSVIIMLSFANIINTSALSYQSNAGLSFTFNPTLSVNISSSDLVISSLTPDTTSDSNIINVSVATNASYGYTLSAMMNGNNSDLIHTDNSTNNNGNSNSNSNNIFSSITTDSSLPNLVTDNTWGYSYKLSNNTNWNNYSGLSNETSKTLVDSNDQTAIPIDFKIGAKASSTQASGTYTGTINFTAVTKHIPVTLAEAYASEGKTMVNGFYTMQDMTSTICSKVEAIGAQLQVLDKRDNKLYWISKLADNHCWMTQNLSLDLSHDRPLTSNDTDLNDSSLSGAYSVGYTYDTSDNIISWTPKNTTRDYQNNTGTAWVNNNNIAYSLDPGEWYWDGDDSGTTACNYLTTACDHFSQTQSETNTHLSIGNYYNWSATIASDNGSSLTASTYNDVTLNPQNSICPKGWRLPTISSQSNIVSGSTNEFARLNYLYNSGATNTDIRLISSPLWFIRAGLVSSNGNLVYSGSGTGYWPSTVYGSGQAYYLDFSATNVKPTNHVNMFFGRSVRCVAR